MRRLVAGGLFLVLLLSACKEEPDGPKAKAGAAQAATRKKSGGGAVTGKAGWSISFAKEPDVQVGGVPAWCAKKGFRRLIGDPVYFSLEKGLLHLVAKPGPIHRKRILLALLDPEKLRKGIESKVLIRLTPKDFELDTAKWPRVRFRMAPVTLPGKGADLRNSDKNDACFYLMLGFGKPIHSFAGVEFPDTLAYVWTDQKWEDPFASDPEYRAFLRYVSVGSGDANPGKLREITRNVRQDFEKAYPELFGKGKGAREGEGTKGGKGAGKGSKAKIPPLRSIAIMVDANTVETKSESVLRSIRFLPVSESGPDAKPPARKGSARSNGK